MKTVLLLISFFIVAFGTPTALPLLGPIAATIGFALFFVVIATMPTTVRFCLGTLFFTSVQLVQLFWFLTPLSLYLWSLLPVPHSWASVWHSLAVCFQKAASVTLWPITSAWSMDLVFLSGVDSFSFLGLHLAQLDLL